MIETARALSRDLVRMPRLVHVGLLLAITAFGLDVAVHVAPGPHHPDGFRPEEHLAHLTGLAAMTLVLAGVVADGIRRQRSARRRRAAPGGSRHAVR